MGAISTVVAVFDMTWLSAEVSAMSAAISASGPVSPSAAVSHSTIAASAPDLSSAVAIAASTAFATPVASPVNTLVVGPGGYRFRDFLRMGLPLQAAALALALLLIPILRPF
jgi:di/tricarboxylate transporter